MSFFAVDFPVPVPCFLLLQVTDVKLDVGAAGLRATVIDDLQAVAAAQRLTIAHAKRGMAFIRRQDCLIGQTRFGNRGHRNRRGVRAFKLDARAGGEVAVDHRRVIGDGNLLAAEAGNEHEACINLRQRCRDGDIVNTRGILERRRIDPYTDKISCRHSRVIGKTADRVDTRPGPHRIRRGIVFQGLTAHRGNTGRVRRHIHDGFGKRDFHALIDGESRILDAVFDKAVNRVQIGCEREHGRNAVLRRGGGRGVELHRLTGNERGAARADIVGNARRHDIAADLRQIKLTLYRSLTE